MVMMPKSNIGFFCGKEENGLAFLNMLAQACLMVGLPQALGTAIFFWFSILLFLCYSAIYSQCKQLIDTSSSVSCALSLYKSQ